MSVVEWHTAGDPLPNPADWLNAPEHEAYAGLAHPRRRREWLFARIALKRLLIEDGWVAGPLQASVLRGSSGKPELRIGKKSGSNPRLLCSLAHCADRVMAACRPIEGTLRDLTEAGTDARERKALGISLRTRRAKSDHPGIGVDLVRMSPHIARRRRFFASPGDDRFDAADAMRDAALLWCLKEAAAKALGLGFGSVFRALVCRNLGGGRCAVEPAGTAFRLTGYVQSDGDWTRAAVGTVHCD